MGQYNIDLVGC